MKTSAIIVLMGVVLLAIPGTAWMGIAVMGIGAIAYMLESREPIGALRGSPKYLPAWPSYPQQAGVNVSTKSPFSGQKDAVSQAQNPLGQAPEGPGIDNGMFSLPVPMDNEVAQFVNLRYKAPTEAKAFTEEKEKRGNPWLPGF